jgi:hypothetical protein
MWIGLEDVGKQNIIIYRSLRREEIRGEILRSGRFFIERDSSWREVLHGERLQGETLSMERTAEERISLWRDSSRRDSLRREPGQLMQGRLVHISSM